MPRNNKGEIIPIFNLEGISRELVKDAFGVVFWQTMVNGQCYYTPLSAYESRSNLLPKQSITERQFEYYRLINKYKENTYNKAENTNTQEVVNTEPKKCNQSGDVKLNEDADIKKVDKNNNKEVSPTVKPAGQNDEVNGEDKSAKISDIRIDDELVGKLADVKIGEKTDINC